MAALKVLAALDSARTQYYHYKAIIIAGMGLFTDAYDLFCIPPIMKLLAHIYYPHRCTDHLNSCKVSPAVNSTMVGMALLGAVIGNLIFGRLGDLVGRRRVYGAALILMLISAIASGFSICTSTTCVLLTLGFFRFLLGVGIGGDYPLSATIMSEFANKNTRGAFIAAVFSMQGFGILVSSTVTMAVCAVFMRAANLSKESLHTPMSADLAWRIILMLGAVPAGMTYYWRMMMPETARYTALVAKNEVQAAKDMEKVFEDVSVTPVGEDDCEWSSSPTIMNSFSNNNDDDYPLFSRKFLFSRHGTHLLACSLSWFLLDVVFYSSNLFQSHIYQHYLGTTTKNAFQEAFDIAKLQAIVAICSTIPGYFFTVYFIDRIGRVKIQMMGFFFMAISLFAIGIPYYSFWVEEKGRNNAGFMILYGLTFFFSNFGPNTTTFIVPAELFPARFRTTCHGISGAAGKLGAMIGSIGFFWASHNKKENGYPKGMGMTASLVMLGGVCIAGMICTYLFTPETKGRSLEDNENFHENPQPAAVSLSRGFKGYAAVQPQSLPNNNAVVA
nr:probable inorganic phosphate transporter 1-9 [Ipomoea batatas]